MPSAFDDAIKAKYLEYLEREMSFIARHPIQAHQSYDSAALIISCLERFGFVTDEEALKLYSDLETALGIAVASMPLRR
jgi:hypothetical protein